jgi:cytochrome-b5 reductase
MANLVNRRLVANALAVLALGGIGAYTASTCLIKNASAESRSAEPHRVFGGGPAFKSLRLHSSENVNDNTKRLRFELPGGESSITGLGLTCESVLGARLLVELDKEGERGLERG